MPNITAGPLGVDFDRINLGLLAMGQVSKLGTVFPILGVDFTIGAGDGFVVDTGFEQVQFSGIGLIYGANGLPTQGVITSIIDSVAGQQVFVMTSLNLSAPTLAGWIASTSSQQAREGVLAGNDLINGSSESDHLSGYAGDDTINGNGGGDLILGGAGNDIIVATDGANYLRGDDGDDSLQGGAGFDDINGNKGNDTIDGGQGGGDWLVGGQGDDLITAHHRDNILLGNLGDDTLVGGDGVEVVRGGKGNDSIVGGSGNEFISGDRGNDTESGGAGADLFHGSQDAGVDKVLDFSQAEGDRVMLDPGTTYVLEQVGNDTVIDMGGGHQMILVGAQLSTLAPGWIFQG